MSKKTTAMMMAAGLTVLSVASGTAVAEGAAKKWDPTDRQLKAPVKEEVMERKGSVMERKGHVMERKGSVMEHKGGEVMENNAAKKLHTNNGIQKRVGPGPVA